MKNQSGITLIEVLAALVIMSILTGVVYGVFINGLNYSSKAKDTVSLQQEANYVLTVLKEQHEKKNYYKIIPSEDQKSITINTIEKIKVIVNGEEQVQEKTEVIVIENENQLFKYEICDINTNSCNSPIEIKDTNSDNLHVKIVIKNDSANLEYEVQTILSRM